MPVQAAGREERRFGQVEVGNEQARLAVRLPAEHGPVGARHSGGAGGAFDGAVDGGEEAGIFGGAAEGGLLVEGVGGIGEGRRAIAAGLGLVVVRMEDHLRAAEGGPANGLGIAPAFVANGDAEGQRAGLEDATLGAGRVAGLFGGVELDLVLKAADPAVGVDDQRGEPELVIDEAFRAEDNGDLALGGRGGDGLPGVVEEVGVRSAPTARYPGT